MPNSNVVAIHFAAVILWIFLLWDNKGPSYLNSISGKQQVQIATQDKVWIEERGRKSDILQFSDMSKLYLE